MPLQRGPMSFRLFDVLYRDEPASFDEFLTVLGDHTFGEYPTGSTASTHTGLVEHLDWTSTELNVPRLLSRTGSVFPDHKTIFFSFRVDTRKVPGRLLKQKVAEAVEAWKKESSYTKSRIPNSVRNDITENVRSDLIRQTPWVPQLIDAFLIQANANSATGKQPLILGILGGDSQADLFAGMLRAKTQEAGLSLLHHAFCPIDSDQIKAKDFARWLWYSSAVGSLPGVVDSYTAGRIEFVTDEDVRIAFTENEDSQKVSQHVRLRSVGRKEAVARLRFSFTAGEDAINTPEDSRPVFILTVAFGGDVTVEKVDIRLGGEAEDGDGQGGMDDFTAREFMTHERISRLLQLRDTLQAWIAQSAKDWNNGFYTEEFTPWVTSLGDHSATEGGNSRDD